MPDDQENPDLFKSESAVPASVPPTRSARGRRPPPVEADELTTEQQEVLEAQASAAVETTESRTGASLGEHAGADAAEKLDKRLQSHLANGKIAFNMIVRSVDAAKRAVEIVETGKYDDQEVESALKNAARIQEKSLDALGKVTGLYAEMHRILSQNAADKAVPAKNPRLSEMASTLDVAKAKIKEICEIVINAEKLVAFKEASIGMSNMRRSQENMSRSNSGADATPETPETMSNITNIGKNHMSGTQPNIPQVVEDGEAAISEKPDTSALDNAMGDIVLPDQFLAQRRKMIQEEMLAKMAVLQKIIQDDPDSLEAQMARIEMESMESNLNSFFRNLDALQHRQAVLRQQREDTVAQSLAGKSDGKDSGNKSGPGMLARLFAGLGRSGTAKTAKLHQQTLTIPKEYDRIEKALRVGNAEFSAPLANIRGRTELLRRQSDELTRSSLRSNLIFMQTREGEEWMKGVSAAAGALAIDESDLLKQVGGWKETTPSASAAVAHLRSQMTRSVNNSMLPEMSEIRHLSAVNSKRISGLSGSIDSLTGDLSKIMKKYESFSGREVDLSALQDTIAKAVQPLEQNGLIDPLNPTAIAEAHKKIMEAMQKMMQALARMFGRFFRTGPVVPVSRQDNAGAVSQHDEMEMAIPNNG